MSAIVKKVASATTSTSDVLLSSNNKDKVIPKRALSYDDLNDKYEELKEINFNNLDRISRMIKKYKVASKKIDEYERKEKEEKQKRNEIASSKRKETIEKKSKIETILLEKEDEVVVLKAQVDELTKKFEPPQFRKPNPWWALHCKSVPSQIVKTDYVNCIDCNYSFSTKKVGGTPRLADAKKNFAAHPCKSWPGCIPRIRPCPETTYTRRKQSASGSFVVDYLDYYEC